MIGVGVLVFLMKWTDRKNASMLAKIVVNVAVPANVIYSFLSKFDKSVLGKSGLYILIGFLMMLVSYYVSVVVARIFKVAKSRRGVFSVMIAFSNSVFIGFPVAKALFGESAMLYAILFYLVNTIMFWTFGYMGIRSDVGDNQKIAVGEILKKLFNIPIMSIALAFVLIMLEVKLPVNVMNTLEYLSNLTTPLSMIFTGIVLADMGVKQLKFERDLVLIIAGRVLVAPLIMLGFTVLFGAQGLGQQVFIMQCTLPVMLQSVILSEYYGADSNFATKGFAWSTMLSLVSIPIFMALISTFL